MRRRRRRRSMVPDMIEFHGKKNCYQLVRDWHIAFGHPYFDRPQNTEDTPPEDIVDWKRLPMGQRAIRGKWMAEEVMEYIKAGDAQQVDQVDALIDLLYFVLGSYVEMGFDPYNDSRLSDMASYGRQLATKEYEYNDGIPPADRLYLGSPMAWRAKGGEDVIEFIFDYIFSATVKSQILSLRDILDWVLIQAAIVGADPYPYFIIVHDANMSKLGPDGKPKYGPDGKVQKGNGWMDPRKEMENLMLNELDKEIEDDKVPF